MNGTLIVTILAAIGGPAGLVALIMVLPQIKKLQADTTKVERDAENADIDGASVLSTAALAQMQAAMERASLAEAHTARLEVAIETMRLRLDALEHESREYRDAAQFHVAWDVQRIRDLIELGVDPDEIPAAPALLRTSLGGRRA